MNVIDLSKITLLRDDKVLLRDINWTIHSGEHWTLLGANGAGKSLLLNIINGYLWPTSGSVTVLGKTFGEYDLRELRKTIGFVGLFLHEQIYRNDTALDIVVSGKYASIGLWEIPSKEDYIFGEELMEEWDCLSFAHTPYRILSQGEKQKILICRSLMCQPALLVFDEPCVGLDIRAREQLLEMIQRLGTVSPNPALIFVTHHVEEIMPVFSHVLLLKEGRVFASGIKQKIINGGLLSRAFDIGISVHSNNGRYNVLVKS